MLRLLFTFAIALMLWSCHQNSGDTKEKTVDVTGTSIDPVQVSPDNYKILLENEYVRVVQYSLKPGEKDNPHNHPPKTMYVISGGLLRVYPENGEPFDAEEIQGTSEWGEKTGTHYVENIGNTTITILLTEIKAAR